MGFLSDAWSDAKDTVGDAVDFFVDPFDLIDTHMSISSVVDDATGQAGKERGAAAANIQKGGVDAARQYSLDALSQSTPQLEAALGEQRGIYDAAFDKSDEYALSALSEYAPRRDLSAGAMSQLGQLYNADPTQRAAGMANFEASPGYNYRMQEGEKGIRRLNNASGQYGSGAMYKDLLRHNQGMASQEYGNYFNRMNTLAGYDPSSEMARIKGALGDQAVNRGSQLARIRGAEGDVRSSSYLAEGAINAGAEQSKAGISAQEALIPGANLMTSIGNISDIASSAGSIYGAFQGLPSFGGGGGGGGGGLGAYAPSQNYNSRWPYQSPWGQ